MLQVKENFSKEFQRKWSCLPYWESRKSVVKNCFALSVATEIDPDSETEPFVITTSATEIEMDRKTRDKPRLKQDSRAWYGNLTKFFDWKKATREGE